MWSRQGIPHIDSREIAWEEIAPGRLGEGDQERVLSHESSSGAHTAVLRLTRPIDGVVTCGLDLFVLEGKAQLPGETIASGSYSRVEEGNHLKLTPDEVVCLVAAVDGDCEVAPVSGNAPRHVLWVDTMTLPWTASAGAQSGSLFVRWLRNDPLSCVFLSAMLPGHHSEESESHPVCEEIFRLSGSLIDAHAGISGPGSYAFRPAGTWHGPLATVEGTVALVRSSGPITTERRVLSGIATWEEIRADAVTQFKTAAI